MFDAVPGPVTTAYIDHLLAPAEAGDYRELIAALLPCFWIYLDVGLQLLQYSSESHPYASWLQTYSDPAFEELNAKAIAVVTAQAVAAGDSERQHMQAAFDASARHELAFFAAVPAGPAQRAT